jgi:hypothetical protein
MGKYQEHAAWRTHTSTVRTQYGIARTFSPWCSDETNLQGVPLLPRVLDLIDVGFAIRMNQADHSMTSAELAQDYFVDLSVSVGRLPFKHGSPHVFRQNSYCYTYQARAVLSGMAQMELMGCPRKLLPRAICDSEYRHLSGECCSLPICFIIIFCLYCNPYADWWKPSVVSEEGGE